MIFIAFICSSKIHSQDLEPRTLSAVPIGDNFVFASYGRSTSNILLDTYLPIEDLQAQLNSFILAVPIVLNYSIRRLVLMLLHSLTLLLLEVELNSIR